MNELDRAEPLHVQRSREVVDLLAVLHAIGRSPRLAYEPTNIDSFARLVLVGEKLANPAHRGK